MIWGIFPTSMNDSAVYCTVYLFTILTYQVQAIMFGCKCLCDLESAHIRTVHFFFLLFFLFCFSYLCVNPQTWKWYVISLFSRNSDCAISCFPLYHVSLKSKDKNEHLFLFYSIIISYLLFVLNKLYIHDKNSYIDPKTYTEGSSPSAPAKK